MSGNSCRKPREGVGDWVLGATLNIDTHSHCVSHIWMLYGKHPKPTISTNIQSRYCSKMIRNVTLSLVNIQRLCLDGRTACNKLTCLRSYSSSDSEETANTVTQYTMSAVSAVARAGHLQGRKRSVESYKLLDLLDALARRVNIYVEMAGKALSRPLHKRKGW